MTTGRRSGQLPPPGSWPLVAPSVAALVAWAALLSGSGPGLELERSAVAAGEWWRLLSGHLVHWSPDHLAWDLVAFLGLGVVVERAIGRRRTASLLVVAAICIALAVLAWHPELDRYRGLSGLDAALFGALVAFAASHRETRGLAALLGLAFTAKVAWELTAGTALFVGPGEGTVVVPVAHLVGGAVGLLSGQWTVDSGEWGKGIGQQAVGRARAVTAPLPLRTCPLSTVHCPLPSDTLPDSMPKALAREIARRRTFAIISHPDAGKTTLTEKLLLFGGAIQLAGEVKARGDRRRARSDWMKVERERGISVTASVMTFDYGEHTFNLLDTPGHEDFSEDTYRTLTAVDSAVMVLDAAKGIESQTRKLFEVCRLRDIPIVTFVNKMDRDGRDPLELLDEIEDILQLEVTPATWPLGMGRSFRGSWDLRHDRLVLLDRQRRDRAHEGVVCEGLDDPRLDELLPARVVEQLREEVELVHGLCPDLDLEAYRAGNQTPVYFGSAISSFGVGDLLAGLAELAPPPGPLDTIERQVVPTESPVTGFVFKIQANMDPKHRDRIAFVRLCSGHFERGMKLFHPRSGKSITVHSPQVFLAQDRERAEEAWPGDILGIPNYGNLRIGDTLTEGEELHFTGVPSFAPELLRRVRSEDPLRAKHLGRALVQLAEEGAARAFRAWLGGEWIVGVTGPLQFEILADRLRTEYSLDVRFESTSIHAARWVEGDDHRLLKKFQDRNEGALAFDHDEIPVFLARNSWHLDKAIEEWPELRFLRTRA